MSSSPSPPRYASVPPPISTTLANSNGRASLVPPSNASTYTLHTISPSSPHAHHARSPLITPTTPSSSYGAAPHSPGVPSARTFRRPLLNAGLKIGTLFLLSTLVMGGTLYLALPTLDDDDRPMLKIPRSFAELQALNTLLKKYRDIYPFRIFLCYIVIYLFLQAFSVPGSMYLSILGGAVWGPLRALPLVCTLIAAGASLCYLISAALGPALLTIPSLHTRLVRWSAFLSPPSASTSEHASHRHSLTSAHTQNLLSLLIILRITPFPPHWTLNILAPHLRIPLSLFFISTWLGVLGISLIHTTIGGGLDQMTSADDFHLLSWRNVLGLSAVVVGALIPVALRYAFRSEVKAVAEVENIPVDEDEDEDGQRAAHGLVPLEYGEEYDDDEVLPDAADDYRDLDDDEGPDKILDVGPALTLDIDEPRAWTRGWLNLSKLSPLSPWSGR